MAFSSNSRMKDIVLEKPLDHAVLGGTAKEKKRAAEIIIDEQSTLELLPLVFHSFPKGDLAKRAWARLAKKKLDVDVLTNVLKQVTDEAVAEAAWAAFAELDPSEGDVTHVMVFAPSQAVKNHAAKRVIDGGLRGLDDLSYVLAQTDVAELLDEAARRLLPKAKIGDHLAPIIEHAHDPELVEAAWARFVKLPFGPDDGWDRVSLRNIMCLHRDPKRRALALELALAKKVVFDTSDAEMIRKHVKDPRARRVLSGPSRDR